MEQIYSLDLAKRNYAYSSICALQDRESDKLYFGTQETSLEGERVVILSTNEKILITSDGKCWINGTEITDKYTEFFVSNNCSNEQYKKVFDKLSKDAFDIFKGNELINIIEEYKFHNFMKGFTDPTKTISGTSLIEVEGFYNENVKFSKNTENIKPANTWSDFAGKTNNEGIFDFLPKDLEK